MFQALQWCLAIRPSSRPQCSRAVTARSLSPCPQLIVEQQDEQLELVSGSIGVLKNMSQRIGGELEEQAV